MGVGSSERARRFIDLACVTQCFQESVAPGGPDGPKCAQNVYVDFRHCVCRKPWGRIRAVASSTVYHSFGKDRVFKATELTQRYRWPCPASKFISEPNIQDLVAECMPWPCTAVAMMAMIFTVPMPSMWAG